MDSSPLVMSSAIPIGNLSQRLRRIFLQVGRATAVRLMEKTFDDLLPERSTGSERNPLEHAAV